MLLWNSACVPMTTSMYPFFKPVSNAFLWIPLSRPVIASTVSPSGSNNDFRLIKCCRAKISVGAIKAICDPDSAAYAQAIAATKVLPEPTSPCNNRVMRFGELISFFISSKTLYCELVGTKFTTFTNSSM